MPVIGRRSSSLTEPAKKKGHAPKKPLTAKQLRDFGFLMAFVFGGIFGGLVPWWKGRAWAEWPMWTLYVGAAFAVPAAVIPMSLGPVFRVWMRIGDVLGYVNSRIILGIIFFVVVLPFGLVRRLFGRDPMDRKFDRASGTYRVSRRGLPLSDMKNPF